MKVMKVPTLALTWHANLMGPLNLPNLAWFRKSLLQLGLKTTLPNIAHLLQPSCMLTYLDLTEITLGTIELSLECSITLLHPAILIQPLSYINVPGSAHPKRSHKPAVHCIVCYLKGTTIKGYHLRPLHQPSTWIAMLMLTLQVCGCHLLLHMTLPLSNLTPAMSSRMYHVPFCGLPNCNLKLCSPLLKPNTLPSAWQHVNSSLSVVSCPNSPITVP